MAAKRDLERWLRSLEPETELAARLALIVISPDLETDKFKTRIDDLRDQPSSDPDRMSKLLKEVGRLGRELRQSMPTPKKG